ncbi:MAG: ion transporter [Bacteroidetes bacterium 4572_117]|nr:MAG: ion transporter [Bacteroidetes bacterium 4572_117]
MYSNFKKRLYDIVFEADTPAGKAFDIALLIAILLSILVVMLESVKEINAKYGHILVTLEWAITFFFTIEYFLRIYIVKKPTTYIFSFFGVIDLLSVLPTYIGLMIAGMNGLIVIRALRLLRIFRILKLSRYVSESKVIISALKASRTKISVFLYTVIMLVIIIGTIMYLVEGEASGFTSIPHGIYWAIVTLTTVGYGDIAPITPIGQLIASFVMILGYAIIAVPTGIVTSELTMASKNKQVSTQVCPNCLHEDHDPKAIYCNICGTKLNE